MFKKTISIINPLIKYILRIFKGYKPISKNRDLSHTRTRAITNKNIKHMNVSVIRYTDTGDESLSLFMINTKFRCYGLEDEKREVKVYGETRIPEGVYKLGLRKVGRWHNSAISKFGPEFHKGMLHVLDVPGFEYILIHWGNNDEDTDGCLLLGKAPNKDNNFISHSVDAYKEVYPEIAAAIENGEDVYITYTQIYNES